MRSGEMSSGTTSERCNIETSIDREGMSDVGCELTRNHFGMHRYEDDQMVVLWRFKSGPMYDLLEKRRFS